MEQKLREYKKKKNEFHFNFTSSQIIMVLFATVSPNHNHRHKIFSSETNTGNNQADKPTFQVVSDLFACSNDVGVCYIIKEFSIHPNTTFKCYERNIGIKYTKSSKVQIISFNIGHCFVPAFTI